MTRAKGGKGIIDISKFMLRDRDTAERVINKIREMEMDIRIMHVCGTHQDTLIKFGLDSMFKESGVEIRQGPGCPVCVTTQREIEECILLARKGCIITVFGDMLKVPGINGSLSDWRANGCDIRIVYSIDDAVKVADKSKKDVVFMGIGFETTAPSTAATVLARPPTNFSILCCHRTVPQALKAIIESGEVKLQGLIEPGHVSTIIGAKPYEFISKNYGVPQVIAGFEPLDLLMGVFMLARQIKNKEGKVEIEYTRSVKYEGNQKAMKMLDDVFEPSDVPWRGFPVIPGSGLKLREQYSSLDARLRYAADLKKLDSIEFKEPNGCRCGDVLRGVIHSDECALLGTKCTPDNPIGPCMVSAEGSCNIVYKYGR